ncbi:hypothetical protein DY000_02053970 [Brassica cretica]|uniref:Uncharacterized protein n=1 Tax=Brassica cretica TaxID=69181 RepID=A0ABQ7AKE7_BRACR|nr:hypothetical protein DY000_02053970 [Brassica cretica]
MFVEVVCGSTNQADFKRRECARTQTRTPEEAINQKFSNFENSGDDGGKPGGCGDKPGSYGEKPGGWGEQTGFYSMEQGRNLSLSLLEVGA